MMTLSLTAFSQVGTVQVPTKCLPVKTLQMISQDLLRYDETKIQLKFYIECSLVKIVVSIMIRYLGK